MSKVERMLIAALVKGRQEPVQREVDEAFEDAQNERRYAVAAHNADSSPALAQDGLIARWLRLYDQPDKFTCDVVYYDRVTGDEVLRYDGADPANTDPYYGASTDGDCFAKKGLDIKELIEPGRQKVSDGELIAKVSRYVDDDIFDDYGDSDEDDSFWDNYPEDEDEEPQESEGQKRAREIELAWEIRQGRA